jgi:Ribbon-helix-helix protein, copG family
VRTTLTIDDDVAAALEGLRRTRDVSLKDLINEALRRGLQDMKRSTKRRERFSTQAVALGRVRIGSLDNISEALAIAESECFK